jgi:hypothetical protein
MVNLQTVRFCFANTKIVRIKLGFIETFEIALTSRNAEITLTEPTYRFSVKQKSN